MSRGRNLAEASNRSIFTSRKASTSSLDVCIFISHISIDKRHAIEIANYIMDTGYDVYIDINDHELQRAVCEGNPYKVTECIEEGVSGCSHLICLVSNETVNSWWVPYEIGFGKKNSKEIATLTIKDTTNIPDYLKVTELIRGTKSLNQYLLSIKTNYGLYKYASRDVTIISESAQNHPLDEYLNWNK